MVGRGTWRRGWRANCCCDIKVREKEKRKEERERERELNINNKKEQICLKNKVFSAQMISCIINYLKALKMSMLILTCCRETVIHAMSLTEPCFPHTSYVTVASSLPLGGKWIILHTANHFATA